MNFIENETSEKLRGGYYTPPDIVAYLLRWVMAAKPKSILEPSCGDGVFFRVMAQDPSTPRLERVVACELDPGEAAKAREATSELAGVDSQVHHVDFLDWVLKQLPQEPEFDAVVGNPPFIRYQYLTDTAQDRAERIIKYFGLRFTKHTNAWVPFVIGSLARLKAGGRLAFVVPSELLHVLHSESVRQFLLRTCSRVLVLDPEELWFENTLQGVVLLLAEKRREVKGRALGRIAITRIRGKKFLEGSPTEHFEQADYIPGESLPSKWMLALLTERERGILEQLRANTHVHSLSKIASVTVGIVTGANKFFLVPDEIVEEYELGKYAHPMFGRSDHVAGVIYDHRSHEDNKLRGVPTNFLWFRDVPRDQLPAKVLQYIKLGEAQKIHQRFKCRIREPWYSVPSVFSSPVGMLKRCHDYPRLVLNQMSAFTTDTAYRINPIASVAAPLLVYSFVNSLTALCAELEGRHYGGGVLELVPSEISRLLIPLPPNHQEFLAHLDAACRSAQPPEALLAQQDRELLKAVALSSAEQRDLQQAWWKLRNRRHRTSIEDAEEDADFLDPPGLSEVTNIARPIRRIAATL